MISIVKHDLDPLMKLSEGNEHFESHSDDADTIKYSICLSNGPVIPQEQKMGNITVIGPDDDEGIKCQKLISQLTEKYMNKMSEAINSDQ